MSLYFKNQTAKFMTSLKQKIKFMKQTLLKHQKIITLMILLFVTQFAKAQTFQLVPNLNLQFSAGFNPQGHYRWTRSSFIITPTEMATSGVPVSQILNYMKLHIFTAVNPAATGTVKIYLQNIKNLIIIWLNFFQSFFFFPHT